jgi:hypothetical protein
MASHTAEQKEFIVRRLAERHPTKAICEKFAQRFPDTACAESDVHAVDPEIHPVSPELHKTFWEARRQADAESPDTANLNVQLRYLHNDFLVERARGNLVGARAILRTIAALTGNVPGQGGSRGTKDAPAGDKVEAVEWQVVDPAPVNAT